MSGPTPLPPRASGEDTLSIRLAGRRPGGTAPHPGRRPSWAQPDPTEDEPRRGGPRRLAAACPRTQSGPRAQSGPRTQNGPPAHGEPPRRRATLRPARPDDPVDQLAAELADDIGAAVHPYEVAAVLESQGMTGDRIQETYGHPDLFSLADALYERVPRSHPEPGAPPDPWRPDHLRCALRGLLFALPGAAYPLAAGGWLGGPGLHALIAAALVSWAWSQALSHRAYLRLAAGPREAARTLLRGAPPGVVCATAAGLAVAGPGPAAVFAVGQSCYLAAAGVLLVLGREKLLAVALLPVAAGAAALPWWQPPTALRLGLPVLTVALAVVAAWHVLRPALRADPAPGPVPRLAHSLPYGLFGLAAGTLATLAGRQDPYAVIVLTLSMGPAEWLLFRYRGLAVAALRSSTTPGGFRLRSTRALAVCVAAHLAPIAASTPLIDTPPAQLLALGAVLWTALLLQAFGVAWPSAALCLGAAATATALPYVSSLPAATAQLAGCTAAAPALLAAAVRHLGRPTAHA
ncbi:hypothetical protein [Streptomyces lasiicapitis]|uniref:hypothetical protein n=1 Tax=Streptomyces lasiicapitis TaxID=1923961 RepID=UPI003656E0DF